MPVPIRYNLRSLLYRKGATIFTLLAVALTVAVLVILLAVHRGFSQSLALTGRADNLIVLRASATSEGESVISRADAIQLAGLPQIAQDADGQPLCAAEMYAALTLTREGGGITNVTLRGATPASFALRPQIRIREGGRAFRPGSREVVVGRNLEGRIQGCRLGGAVRISDEDWAVVGVMEGGDTAFDSEVWGDVEGVLQVFDRTFFNSFHFRAAPGTEVGLLPSQSPTGEATGLIRYVSDRIGAVKILTEQRYFSDQGGFLGAALQGAAIFLTLLMSFGALAGLLNTFLAAVAGRTREIGALLAIGYRPGHVFLGFLVEAVALALAGGAAGILLALPWNGVRTGTTNWATFTEQAFAFRIDGPVILPALILALLVGLIGGVIPAWRAARLRPAESLRRG
jgi:putative ABC transport system permease protein